MGTKIQELLKQARSSTEGDTSANFAKRIFSSGAECSDFFRETKNRLLLTEEWNKNSTSSSYKLFDNNGNEIDGEPISVGSFIRITLHGSGKHDWVEVVSIYEPPAEFVITVKPTFDPIEDPPNKTVISHFFIPEARNNFCLQKNARVLTFYVIGIGEKQNTARTVGIVEMIRNSATANLGYYLGIQKAAWTEFCTNFLKTDKE